MCDTSNACRYDYMVTLNSVLAAATREHQQSFFSRANLTAAGRYFVSFSHQGGPGGATCTAMLSWLQRQENTNSSSSKEPILLPMASTFLVFMSRGGFGPGWVGSDQCSFCCNQRAPTGLLQQSQPHCKWWVCSHFAHWWVEGVYT